jgi:hypothetical protein
MMYKAFLVKYAEIGIKGKNRHLFEKALCLQMEHALAPVDGIFQVTREMGRIYVNTEGDFDYEGAVDALTRVFGIAEICPVVILEDTGFEDLAEAVVSYCAALFFLNLAVTHYVSLGSMMVYVVFFAMAVIMGQAGCFALEPPYLYEMYVVIALLAVLAFWEHRANIKRLIAGTERKTYLSKKSEK